MASSAPLLRPEPSSVGSTSRRTRGFWAHAAAFVVGGVALASVLSSPLPSPSAGRAAALVEVLAARGLVASPDDVVWVDQASSVAFSASGHARAVVRAAPAKGEPNDIYLVETRLSPEGVLLGVGSAFDLSETTGADEGRPVVRGERVAYAARGLFFQPNSEAPAEGEEPEARVPSAWVHVVDLHGRAPLGSDWTAVERAQNALTSYQQTGQLRGIDKQAIAVDPAPTALRFTLEDDAVVIHADDREAKVTFGEDRSIDASALPEWLRVDKVELAHPGNVVTWSVDRVRAVIGDDSMQTVKAVAFTALDFVLRNKEMMTGDTGAEDIAADLGQNDLAPPARTEPIDPEIGWPPQPLESWVTPALGGEGQWNLLDQDPFVRTAPGLPAIFVTTFIRADRSRKATRVYIAMWDPRQIELHMMAGTVEPKSATGEAGPGLIPRTPEIMKRVVAASNAGFQALHGEFGMMADGVVYLPPKPYAATVAALRDGSTAFGSWPLEPTIPDEVLSYRQNMTVMVLDEKFNPYGRTWWGGTPPGWADKTHTVRTGMCLTRERYVAYFYGTDIGPEALSQSMIQARCSFGIALDMNAGHSGLEFYKVTPEAEMPELGRPLHTDWEAEGVVSGIDGYEFRGRRFIRGMGLMNFPRYIRREGRDFFYMTLRPMLPGPAIDVGETPAFEGEGAWRVKGLAQHGFPYAVALTELSRGGDDRLRLLKIDPRMVAATPASSPSAQTVAVLSAGETEVPGPDAASLWWSSGAFSIGDAPPLAGAVRLASGAMSERSAVAAVGVRDEDGMLVYVERSGAAAADSPDGEAPAGVAASVLLDPLKKLGASTWLLLDRSLEVALGGDTDLAGKARHPPSGASAIRLVRAEAPGGRRIFEDTPVVPLDVWYPLQAKRIRYFKKQKSAESEGASAEPEPAP